MAEPKTPSERELEAEEARAAEPDPDALPSSESSTDSEPAENPSSAADQPAPANRAEARKAARKGGASEDIRDRNQRVREEAAARRRSKREAEERVVQARNLDASEIMDDALARGTQAAANFLKRNINIVQWVVVLGVVGGIGYQIWSYRHTRSAARTTDELAKAIGAEQGRVGTEATGPDPYTGLPDSRRSFPDDAARLKAAADQYAAVKGSAPSKVATLASMGLAGVLYDQGKFKAARDEYGAVRASELAKSDNDLRCRAIEGVGLTWEAENQLDQALTAFRELENTDVPGFSALGQYHQARLLVKKGEREAAKKLLTTAQEKLKKARDAEQSASTVDLQGARGFLEHQVQELLVTVDPNAAPKPAGGLTPEQIRRIQSQIQAAGNGKVDQAKMNEMLRALSNPASAPASSGSAEPAAPTEDAP